MPNKKSNVQIFLFSNHRHFNTRNQLGGIIILGIIISNLISINDAFLNSGNQNIQMLARWCCLNQAEYTKCKDWSLAANSTSSYHASSASGFGSFVSVTNSTNVLLECVLGTDKYDCFRKIFEDKADLMTADAGEVYTAGKFYNLIPISTENYYTTTTTGASSPSISSSYSDYYSVAIVKKGSGMNIGTLRGSNSCHGGVGTSSGWNMPISTLIEKQLLEIVDCNNHVKAATKFFNKMCAPDALNTQFNPTGDNPTSACDLCKGKIGSTFCTNQDPYAGPLGAMYCLIDGGGDVAFVKHTTLYELAAMNSSIKVNDFQLLCPNVYGSPFNSPGQNVSIYPYPTAPISDYKLCNWGVVPARAVLTSSRKALIQRENYRKFLDASAKLFAGQSSLSSLSTSSSVNSQYSSSQSTQATINPNLK
jgi:melanoma-associated antigen p97